MARPFTSIIERFWSKVDRDNGSVPAHRPDLHKCWIWTGAKSNGYGVLGRGGRGTGVVRATHVAINISTGHLVPEGSLVCHACDNPSCVRPSHLFVGTAADNSADSVAKGRAVAPPLHAGSDCHLAKLRPADVIEIRRLAASGAKQRAIAQRFSIHRSNVSAIVRGTTWRHL